MIKEVWFFNQHLCFGIAQNCCAQPRIYERLARTSLGATINFEVPCGVRDTLNQPVGQTYALLLHPASWKGRSGFDCRWRSGRAVRKAVHRQHKQLNHCSPANMNECCHRHSNGIQSPAPRTIDEGCRMSGARSQAGNLARVMVATPTRPGSFTTCH